MESFQTRRMRAEVLRKALLLGALIATGLVVEKALAETSTPEPRTTTLVVFAEHRMAESEWSDLFQAIHVGAADVAKEAGASRAAGNGASAGDSELRGRLEILRGDTLPVGLHVDSPVAVYLHGNCTLRPGPPYMQAGRLGWVLMDHARIAPYIHVDCEHLADMLGWMALGMSQPRRNMVMAEAMARVILHEWIHVATQNPGHEEHGVAKRQFGVRDLLADDYVLSGREKKKRKG